MSKSSMTKHKGAIMGLAAAALFGASTPFAKVLLGNGTDPWLLAALLYWGSGLGLTLVSVLHQPEAGESRLQARDLGWLLLVILTGGCCCAAVIDGGSVSYVGGIRVFASESRRTRHHGDCLDRI